MPVIRINANRDQAVLHGSPRPLAAALAPHQTTQGPVVVMIHGYKFLPGHALHCPHDHILATHPRNVPFRPPSWPRQLGFGTGNRDEGLAIAFGWSARGPLWRALRRARRAGRALAQVLLQLHQHNPRRPVHIVAHSMGIELALEALHHLPPGAVQRVLSLTGASYQSRLQTALQTRAGRQAEFVNVTSRENDLFDFLYERLIAPPTRQDRSIGQGISAPNALTLQLDCPQTLRHLARLGAPIGAPQRRICHWSSYTRPGVLRFYHDLLRQPDRLSLPALQQGLPEQSAPRWSRLITASARWPVLPFAQKEA